MSWVVPGLDGRDVPQATTAAEEVVAVSPGAMPRPPAASPSPTPASPAVVASPLSAATSAASAGAGFIPCLRLRTEPLVVDDGLGVDPREVVLPVLELAFEHAPGQPPDRAREQRARYLLESFGAVELACLPEYSAPLGSRAEYLVRVDEDVHGLCGFSAYALPQLRALGWRVEVVDDYPFQVVPNADRAPWYARVDDADAGPDWFNLELGVEIDGTRVNLLPALLDLLDRLPHAGRLDRLIPSGPRCFALPVGDKRYLPVPPERLRMLVGVLRALYDPDAPGRNALAFPAAKATCLAELNAAFADGNGDDAAGPGKLRWEGATAVFDRGHALAAGPAPGAAGRPTGLQATLRPYQLEGLAWLQHLRAHDAGGVLADDMGLGKTIQVIAHLVAEKEAGRLDAPALVVAPTSLMTNWRRELHRFAPHLRVTTLHGAGRHALAAAAWRSDVVLTTYAVLVRDQETLAARPLSFLILDEAQAIKNPRAQARKAALTMQARHHLCLSGTPIENSLSELWSLFDLLMPGLLGDADWFRHRFTTPIEREGNDDRMTALRAQVAPFILRRTKEEVAKDLPPKTEIVRPVELRGPQRDLYESLRVAAHAEVRQTIRRKGLGASTIAILDALMKLRQVCCDPRLLRGDTAQGVRTSAKLDLLMELLDQQLGRGRRVLIFSQFASMLALIAEALRARKVGYTELTGATPDRQKAVDTFEQRRVPIFLISLKAGGTGLNLTSADTVVHYDPWWNPAAQAQATDRAHRIGQTRPVFVYKLIVAGSVEERMLGLQRRKQQLADGLLGRTGHGALPLSEGEVDRLFAPIVDDTT